MRSDIGCNSTLASLQRADLEEAVKPKCSQAEKFDFCRPNPFHKKCPVVYSNAGASKVGIGCTIDAVRLSN